MSADDIYELYAVYYAVKGDRLRHENFLASDPHTGPMPLDYYLWVIRNEARTIVVDTGFGEREARNRNRTLLRHPVDGLAALGVDAQAVDTVIVTHMHYDHAGSLDGFDSATFHLQDLEMQFATGRLMTAEPFAYSYSVDDVCRMVRNVYAGRVAFHDGDDEIAPGVSVHHIGGHTQGLQCVRVRTARGWVVLASDACHYYENMDRTAPFPIVHSLADMIAGYDRLRDLATSPAHIVPGHDPLVRARYPILDNDRAFVVRLDVAPQPG